MTLTGADENSSPRVREAILALLGPKSRTTATHRIRTAARVTTSKGTRLMGLSMDSKLSPLSGASSIRPVVATPTPPRPRPQCQPTRLPRRRRRTRVEAMGGRALLSGDNVVDRAGMGQHAALKVLAEPATNGIRSA